jgi:hypothetical protein
MSTAALRQSQCQALEELLESVDVPWNRKKDLYTNPVRVEWLHKNFDKRNANHPNRDKIMSLVNQILGN